MFIELSAGIKSSKKAVSFLSRGDVEAVSAVGSLFTPAEVVCGLLNAAVMEAIGRSSATSRISLKAARALYSLLICFAHKHQFAIPIKMPRCCRNDDKIMALCNLWLFFFLVLLGHNGTTQQDANAQQNPSVDSTILVQVEKKGRTLQRTGCYSSSRRFGILANLWESQMGVTGRSSSRLAQIFRIKIPGGSVRHL